MLRLSRQYLVADVSFVRRDGTTFAHTLNVWHHRHAVETWLVIMFMLLTSVTSEYLPVRVKLNPVTFLHIIQSYAESHFPHQFEWQDRIISFP